MSVHPVLWRGRCHCCSILGRFPAVSSTLPAPATTLHSALPLAPQELSTFTTSSSLCSGGAFPVKAGAYSPAICCLVLLGASEAASACRNLRLPPDISFGSQPFALLLHRLFYWWCLPTPPRSSTVLELRGELHAWLCSPLDYLVSLETWKISYEPWDGTLLEE